MKFSQLRLLVAISKLDVLIPDKSAARKEYIEQVRDEYCRLQGDVCFPFSSDEVADTGLDYRKNKQTRIKADIAEAHGVECFWRLRDKGPCSEDAEAGHVCPASEGNELSVANGMIECRAHNRLRSTRTIEEFLKSPEVTREDPDESTRTRESDPEHDGY